jgi:dipeptidase D
MERVLSKLQPSSVFHFFEEISMIPRGSGNEKNISDYLVDFAKKRNLEVIQDEALNVIIKKPGTKGHENATTVILQGHMDMVCEKNKDTVHDFEKDPIKLMIDGDFIKAQGTTLGADNGIAVAYCLALLDSVDIPHPPLEVVITTEEETGMGGAANLDPKNITGKILINIDAENEGRFFVSCAGGVRSKVILPIEWENTEKDYNTYILKVRGLKGGHSGMEIDKGRGNANKIMGRILYDLNSSIDFHIADINGGAKMNAIPREADAVILADDKEINRIHERINEWNKTLKNELKSSDSDITVIFEKLNENRVKIFSNETKNKAIALLNLILNGVQTMSMEIKGLVQSSTNLGVVTTKDNEIVFESAIRSSVKSLKRAIVDHTEIVAKIVEAKMITESDYPEWEYNPNSYIRKVFEKVYREKYNKEPEICAIHAGLECGLFKEKLGDVDMIAFGPDMYDVHTPDERLSISSTARTWEFLLDVLKEIE